MDENNTAIYSIEKLREFLLANKLTMGTAESCTGGNIAHIITSAAGSSAYFTGAVVAYSNTVKRNVLKVSQDDINNYGAVSQQVVEQMAQGAIAALGCDCAVATSGIAGPTGGTLEKPVGTVWIACIYKNDIFSELFCFNGDRASIIQQASVSALVLLQKKLQLSQISF
jgi:PncC family amidohydrolase